MIKIPSTLFYSYDSIEEMKKAAVPHSLNKSAQEKDTDNMERKSSSQKINWYGFASTSELLTTIERGWSEGVKRIQEIRESIREIIVPVGKTRRKKHGEQGDEIDIDRYLAKEFDSMMISNEKILNIKPNSPITLAVLIGGSCKRSTEELFWKGATASILSDMLEEAGYRVRIIGAMHLTDTIAQSPRVQVYHEITLKDFNESLNLESIVTTTALSGFFRWYGFRLIWSMPYITTADLGFPLEFLPSKDKADIVVANIFDAATAFQTINAILNQLIVRR